jgi:transcriptional regulator with XRE-family HTH domain
MKNDITKHCHDAFGKYIKEARKRKRLTQTSVAEKLGVTQSYYSRIENGDRDVDLAVAFEICNVLGLNISDFANEYM